MTTDTALSQDLPGTLRLLDNGALVVKADFSDFAGALWWTLVQGRTKTRAGVYEAEIEGSVVVGAVPGTAASTCAITASPEVVDDGPAVEDLAKALHIQQATEYARNPLPWDDLRPEDQRRFRRQARAVLPVLARWRHLADTVAATTPSTKEQS